MKLTVLPKSSGFEIELDPQDLELEALCPGTVGEGCSLGRNRSGGTCATCGGSGIVMTAMGEHLMSFLIRHAAGYREKQKKGKHE